MMSQAVKYCSRRYTTLHVLQEGLCFLIVSLGRAVPNQSSFFLSYVLQESDDSYVTAV